MNSGSTLSIGATGHDVRRLQRIFVMTKALVFSDITGSFDVTTEQAVKDFQQGAGLTVDGIVGPVTWQALPADPDTPVLSRGASGSLVTALQQGLKKSQLRRPIRVWWTGSSVIRRGGFPRVPRVLLSLHFPDLRRYDLTGLLRPSVTGRTTRRFEFEKRG
jgi:peptidoglycan hydrolase-like protein with peptidoglycan-binding domain